MNTQTHAENMYTKQEASELVEYMVHDRGVWLSEMMGQAGEAIADFLEKKYPEAKRILILSGSGNTGGLGLFAGKALKERGYRVRVLLARAEEMMKRSSQDVLKTLVDSGAVVNTADMMSDEGLKEVCEQADCIIDALIGRNVEHTPYEETCRLIDAGNASERPIIALDVPSGVHPDSGVVKESKSIHASATLAIGYPLVGLRFADEARGEVFALNIGAPEEWFRSKQLTPVAFSDTSFAPVEVV